MSTTAQATEVKTLDNYVDGAWAPATERESLDDVDPFTGEVAARVPLSGPPRSTRRFARPERRSLRGARCRRSAARAR